MEIRFTRDEVEKNIGKLSEMNPSILAEIERIVDELWGEKK